MVDTTMKLDQSGNPELATATYRYKMLTITSYMQVTSLAASDRI